MAKNRHLKILLIGCNSRATVFTKGIPSGEPWHGYTEHNSELLVDPIFNRMSGRFKPVIFLSIQPVYSATS